MSCIFYGMLCEFDQKYFKIPYTWNMRFSKKKLDVFESINTSQQGSENRNSSLLFLTFWVLWIRIQNCFFIRLLKYLNLNVPKHCFVWFFLFKINFQTSGCLFLPRYENLNFASHWRTQMKAKNNKLNLWVYFPNFLNIIPYSFVHGFGEKNILSFFMVFNCIV